MMLNVKNGLMPHVNSKGPIERIRPYILTWTFTVRRLLLQYLLILQADTEDPDQPAQMRRLIRDCVVRKFHRAPFRALRINCTLMFNHRNTKGKNFTHYIVKT